MAFKLLFHSLLLCLFISCSTYVTPLPKSSELCGKEFVQKTKIVKNETCTAIDLNLLHPERKGIWGKKALFWQPGTTLRVKWMNGDPSQQQKMWRRFQVLQNICNIKFELVDSGSSHLRVAFDLGEGHYSYLGVQNNRIPQTQKTMNIGLRAFDSEEEWSRVGIHEILHALGFQHELQHPYIDIPWDKERVYAYYSRTQGWSRAQVDAQVLNKATPDDFIGSKFDASSIMCYPVSSELTVNGFSVGWNVRLSPCDVEVIQKIYSY